MADFLFDFRTAFDTGGIDAFVQRVKTALSEVSSAGAGAPAQLAQIRTAASQTLAGLPASGISDEEIKAKGRELSGAYQARVESLLAETDTSKQLDATQRKVKAELEAQLNSLISRRGYGAGNAPIVTREQAQAALTQVGDTALAAQTPQKTFDNARTSAISEAEAAELAATKAGVDARVGETLESLKLRTIVAERTQSEQQRAALAREALSAESGEAEAIVQRMVDERALNKALNERVAVELKARAAAGDTALQGSFFQNIQASAAARAGGTPRLPAEFATLSQFITSKALTTAGFAVAGVGLYGGIQTIKDAIAESEKLQESLNGLKAQFKATDQEASFPEFRQAILDIAKDTGTAGSEVAGLAPLFVAAFGPATAGAQALRDAVIGIKAGAFTQQDSANISNSVKSTFGVTVQEITDQGLHLQDVFGVASDEILKGTADLAPVAKQVGLTFQQTSTIIAAAAQAAGQPASQIAGLLDRTLPTLQQKAAQVLALYQSIPALAGKAPQIAAEFGAGDTGGVFIQIIRDYKSLSASQQESLLTTIASRRELAALIPLLQQSGVAVKELDGGTSAAGRTQQGFDEIMKSIGERFKQLSEQFKQIGQDLLRAGVGDLLKDLALAGGVILTVFGGVVHLFAEFNQATHGLAAQLVGLYLTLKLISAVAGTGAVQGALSGVLGGLGSRVGAASIAARAVPTVISNTTAASTATVTEAAGLGSAAAGGAAAESLGLGFLPGIGAAALVLGVSYQAIKSKNDAAVASYANELKSKTDEQLQTIVNDRGSALDKIGATLSESLGFSSQRLQAQDTLAGRHQPQPDEAQAALNAGLLKGYDPQIRGLGDVLKYVTFADDNNPVSSPEQLLADAAKGKGDAIREEIKQLNAIKGDPAKRAKLEAELGKLRTEQTNLQTQADAKSGQILVNTQQAVQDYDAGNASLAETVSNIQKNVDNLKSVKGSDLGLNDQYAKALKAQSQFLSARAREATDLRIQAAEAGGDDGSAAVSELTAFLNDPTVTDPKQRFKAAHDLLAAEKKIADATKKAVVIPPEARSALIQEQEDLSPQISAFEQQFSGALTAFGSNFDKDVADLVAGGLAYRDAIRQVLQKMRDTIAAKLASITGGFTGGGLHGQQVANQRAALAGDLGQVDSALADLPSADLGQESNIPGVVQPTAAVASATEIASARRALAKAQAHGDPILVAQNDLAAANQDLAEALNPAQTDQANARILESQDALSKAYDDISKSRLALAKAQAGDNALEQAKIGQREADLAAQTAIGEAAKVDAQAQQVNADRTLQKAIADTFNAQTELAIAVANAAGDSVKAAQLGAQEAQDKLNFALQQNQASPGTYGPAELARLQANVVTAGASAVDAQIQQAEQNAQFLKDMGKITTQQEIAYYEQILQYPNLNKKQIDDITLAIHNLRLQLGQDLQFNIPQDIQLPTLYEARRLNQSGGNPAAYQSNRSYADNRQISLQMNVNSNTDYQAAFDTFRGIAVEPGLQYGTQGSLYSGA